MATQCVSGIRAYTRASISFEIPELSFKSRRRIIHYGDNYRLKQRVIANFDYNYTDVATLNTRESEIYVNQLLNNNDEHNYYELRCYVEISLRNVTVFLYFYYDISLQESVLSLFQLGNSNSALIFLSSVCYLYSDNC